MIENKHNGYLLEKEQLILLHRVAAKATRLAQVEVCGLVGVTKTKKIKFYFMENNSSKPGRFDIKMSDVRKMAKQIRTQGLKVLGSFHSHPISEAIPSEGDLKEAFFLGHELIYDVIGKEARIWKYNKRMKSPKEILLKVT